MTITEINILNVKASKRKDGVYSYKGYYWVVKGNAFIAFADYGGEVYLRQGSFNYQLAKIDTWKRREFLKTLLKTN